MCTPSQAIPIVLLLLGFSWLLAIGRTSGDADSPLPEHENQPQPVHQGQQQVQQQPLQQQPQQLPQQLQLQQEGEAQSEETRAEGDGTAQQVEEEGGEDPKEEGGNKAEVAVGEGTRGNTNDPAPTQLDIDSDQEVPLCVSWDVCCGCRASSLSDCLAVLRYMHVGPTCSAWLADLFLQLRKIVVQLICLP